MKNDRVRALIDEFGVRTLVLLAYDAVQRLTGGTPYPWRTGTVPPGERTPSLTLNLQPGEWVRVKSYEEILRTINEEGNNRGMSFDAEMVPYCCWKAPAPRFAGLAEICR